LSGFVKPIFTNFSNYQGKDKLTKKDQQC